MMTGQPPAKKPRRASWKPEGAAEEDFSDLPEDTRAEDYADRTPSTDEDLKRDKPPHWA